MRPTYEKKFGWKFHNSQFGFWDFENPKILKIPKNPKIPNPLFPLDFSILFEHVFLIV
jgi:hypothetical protein